ncbi:MAG: hypothetical protein DSO07_10120 [Thermoproteota archaeon]|jgi:hypothetical protein|nr:MAG: hypothetical protein DSO07_10120 [Candidatus Korarchaeota archaeon]
MRKSVYLAEDEYNALEKIAEEDGDNLNNVLRRAVRFFVKYRRLMEEGYRIIPVKVMEISKPEQKGEEQRKDSQDTGASK